MKGLRKTLSFTLAFTLLFQPVAVFADEEDGSEEEVVYTIDGEENCIDDLQTDEVDSELPDSDDLFSMYVDEQFGTSYYESEDVPILTSNTDSRDNLNDYEKVIYDKAKELITSVAKGETSSTNITVTWSSLGIDTPTMAVSGLYDYTVTNGTANTTVNQTKLEAAKEEFEAEYGVSSNKIMSALCNDCPSELYWFGRSYAIGSSTGYGCKSAKITGTSGSIDGYYCYSDDVVIRFTVSKSYSTSGANGTYVADTSSTSKAYTSSENAKTVRDKCASMGDYEKLLAYKKWLCENITYDYVAAGSNLSSIGSGPWELIYAFDGDSSTNVVCEGYSKAFQYLCDLSTFTDSIWTSSVTGTVSCGGSGGAHKWNIVHWGDDNYLVDVTNCDDEVNDEGNTDLFMRGYTSGNITDGYQFDIEDSDPFYYNYDSDMVELYEGREADITISDSDFSTPSGGDESENVAAYENDYPDEEFVDYEIIGDGNDIIVSYSKIEDESYDTGYKTILRYAPLNSDSSGQIPDFTSVASENISFLEDYNSFDEVIVAEGITYIGDYSLSGIQGTVYLPDTLTEIGEYAFYKHESIEDLIIPDSVETIGAYAFDGITNSGADMTISIGSGLQTVGEGAFYSVIFSRDSGKGNLDTGELIINVDSLEHWCNITFEDEFANPLSTGYTWHNGDEDARNKQNTKFYVNGEEVSGTIEIPDTVTELKDYVFVTLPTDSSIDEIYVGKNITSIGTMALTCQKGSPRICIYNEDCTITAESNTVVASVYYYMPNSTFESWLTSNSKDCKKEIDIYKDRDYTREFLSSASYPYFKDLSYEKVDSNYLKFTWTDNTTEKSDGEYSYKIYLFNSSYSFDDYSESHIAWNEYTIYSQTSDGSSHSITVAADNEKNYCHWRIEKLRANDVDDWSDYYVQSAAGTIASWNANVIYSNDASVTGYSLTLGGDIGVNFYVKLSKELISNSDSHMVFTLPDGSTEKVYISDAEEVSTSTNTYKFSCHVNATQMASDISATFVAGSASTASVSMSVKSYADNIIIGSSYTDTEKAIVKALLNYGSYAQLYYDYNTDELASDYTFMDDEDKELDESADEAALSDNSVLGSVSGITYYGSSLLTKTNTAIRHYFYITDSSKTISDYVFKVGSTTLTPGVSGNLYYIDITAIQPADYDTSYTVTVNGSTFISYSVNDYLYRAVNSTNKKLKDFACAIFEYGKSIE